MRKLIYGALTLGAALAVSFGVGAVDASAAATTTVKVDGANTKGNLLTLAPKTDDTEVKSYLVGVPTFKGTSSGSGASATVTVSDVSVATWDIYSAGAQTDGYKTTIDLSNYKTNKDNYLMVKSDLDADEDALLIKIPKSDSVSIVSLGNDGVMTIKGTTGKVDCYTDEGDMEKDISTTSVIGSDTDRKFTVAGNDRYRMSGATLYVRASQEDNTSIVEKTTDDLEGISCLVGKNTKSGKLEGSADHPYVVLGKRPGAPAKKNVTRWGNAPKITVNYAKGTIMVPGGSHFEFVPKTSSLDTNAFPIATHIPQPVGKTTNNQTFKVDNQIKTTEVFAVDVYKWAAGTGETKTQASRIERTVFKGLVDTDITDGDQSNPTKLLKAEIRYNAKSKKYDLNFKNEDSNKKFYVWAEWKKAASDETLTPTTEVEIKNQTTRTSGSGATASTTVIPGTGKIANIPGTVFDPDKDANSQAFVDFKVYARQVGDASTKTWPCNKIEIPDADITKVRAGDSTAPCSISPSLEENDPPYLGTLGSDDVFRWNFDFKVVKVGSDKKPVKVTGLEAGVVKYDTTADTVNLAKVTPGTIIRVSIADSVTDASTLKGIEKFIKAGVIKVRIAGTTTNVKITKESDNNAFIFTMPVGSVEIYED